MSFCLHFAVLSLGKPCKNILHRLSTLSTLLCREKWGLLETQYYSRIPGSRFSKKEINKTHSFY